MHLAPHGNMLINTDIGAILVKLYRNIIVIIINEHLAINPKRHLIYEKYYYLACFYPNNSNISVSPKY